MPDLRARPAPDRAVSAHRTSAPRDRAETAGRARRLGRRVVLAGWTALLLINLAGLPYFLLPQAERVRHPLHATFRATGYVGQSLGLLALTLFLTLYLYPLRKRVRALRFTGSLARWLDVHIVFGLALPLIGATHAGWRFNGVIGLGYLSMLVVALSGLIGRYLYVHIPRSAEGIELTRDEVASERRSLVLHIATATGIEPERIEGLLPAGDRRVGASGVLATLAGLALGDVTRWRVLRRMRDELERSGGGLEPALLRQTIRLADRHARLVQQARMLEATRRVFRLWHVAHRPFAFTALAAVLIHVGVAVALGLTWLW